LVTVSMRAPTVRLEQVPLSCGLLLAELKSGLLAQWWGGHGLECLHTQLLHSFGGIFNTALQLTGIVDKNYRSAS